MEWVIVRVTDGKYLATKSLYVHFCEFARRFRTKKQADAYIDRDKLDKNIHVVRCIKLDNEEKRERPIKK